MKRGKRYKEAEKLIDKTKVYNVKEATTTSTVGYYQYDVPFPTDDETMKRHNGVGGSVSVNKA